MSIEVQNISKNYGAQKALNNISFTVKKGEIVGFILLTQATLTNLKTHHQ